MKTLNHPCNLPLIALLAAALLAPLQAWAATPALAAQEPCGAHDLRAMADGDLGAVTAQGLTDDFLHPSVDNDNAAKANGLKVIDTLDSTMSSRTRFLDAETTMKEVAYDPARARSVFTPDGSVLQVLPRSIGELSFENIRIKGNPADQSFGSVSIKGIEFGNSTLTLTPRR